MAGFIVAFEINIISRLLGCSINLFLERPSTCSKRVVSGGRIVPAVGEGIPWDPCHLLNPSPRTLITGTGGASLRWGFRHKASLRLTWRRRAPDVGWWNSRCHWLVRVNAGTGDSYNYCGVPALYPERSFEFNRKFNLNAIIFSRKMYTFIKHLLCRFI